jgi:flagellar biogenesis protein FliO
MARPSVEGTILQTGAVRRQGARCVAPAQSIRVPDGNRKWWITLSTTGAFIIFAGLLAPKLINTPIPPQTPTNNPALNDAALPASTTPPVNTVQQEEPKLAFPTAIPAEIRGSVERLAIGAGVIIAVAVAIAWLRRRSASKAPSTPGLLNVTAALVLPHRCCLYLIEVGSRQFITGVDGNGIHALTPLPDATDQPADEPTEPKGLGQPSVHTLAISGTGGIS